MQNGANRKIKLSLSIYILMPLFIFAQAQTPLAIGVTPGGQMPLGPVSTGGQQIFNFGGGGDLSIEYSMPFAPFLYAKGSIGYTFLPTFVQTSLSLVSFGAGAGVRLSLLPQMETQLSGIGGYAIGMYQGSAPGGAAFICADAKILYYFLSSFAIGLGASYNYYFGAYNGVGIFLGVSFRPQLGPVRAQLEMPQIQLDPVFPVFYKYYDDHPIGKVTIRNGENGSIRDVTVSLFVQQYMVQPKECITIKEIAKGGQQEVALYALFKDDILRITEDTKVPALVQVTYTYMDTQLEADQTQTLRVHHRNAMNWDDDKKAAAFVNAKDPLLLQYAKGVTGEVRNRGATAVNRQIREAMGLFDSLKLYGVNYVVDPSSSYATNSANESVVDFLQFPTQTLTYRAGDCDDLSILYSALLEAVGIETAFITVPGHIYMAFKTDIALEEATKSLQESKDFIIRDGNVWVPIEVTMIKDGFLKAWAEGVRQWTQNNSRDKAKLYPIHDAWKTFEPVAGSDPGTTLAMPNLDAVVREYQSELVRYVQQQVQGPAADIQAQIKRSSNDPKLINKLGVLYAKYGMYAEAGTEFQKAAASGLVSAMVNLGNVASLLNDHAKALGYYTQAVGKDPSNIAAVEGMAKENYAMENYGVVKELYQKLKQLSPKEAERVAYLIGGQAEGARAAEAGTAAEVIWVD